MNYREMCYDCNRPKRSCLCFDIQPIETSTKFVILMHPKEFKYIKNNTGRLTYLSLKNSELFVGVDFSNDKRVNNLIDNPKNHCVILYPDKKCLNLSENGLNIDDKGLVIFIIDATWDSAKPILRRSTNLHNLPRISFSHTKTSAYNFKRQPFAEALSTMESTLCVLELLNYHGMESISNVALEDFLTPFEKMVKFQMEFVNSQPRFKR